jgi:peptidoglycan/xylan/chitin deacetylase (PgdA/CDA1 family)
VIALRFDDAPTEFVAKVLPLLRERGLPFTRVTTSDSIASTGETITDTDLTTMQTYSIQDGGEVWNHGRDHANATGQAAIYDNLIGALDKLREKMPRIPIDCFAPPGGAGISYSGHMPSYTVANWANTYAGHLLRGHHAISSGYFQDTYYRPIDGVLRDGQIHYSNDNRTVAATKQLIDRARDWRVGVVMMWHAHNLDAEGQMTTAGLTEVLDYLVEQRDAGDILVLTVSGLGVADVGSDQRDDLLRSRDGSPFTETTLYPQYRQSIPGSTRELLATVTGTAGQTVTSSIGESVRTHTIPASGTLQLRHVATIPVDASSLVVDVDAATTGARLLAV